MSDNKASLAAGASKFADKDEESSEDETSSFEEVSKPVERHTAPAARQEEKPRSPVMAKQPEPRKPSPDPTPAPSRVTTTSEHKPTASVSASTPSGAAAGLKDYLADIKSTLQQQNQVCDQSCSSRTSNHR
jgi:coronin-1B/1C/6